MNANELVPVLVELVPNPLPYGRLAVRRGLWDQMQAQKAYVDGDGHATNRQQALDRKA